jgi:hypothetical protein
MVQQEEGRAAPVAEREGKVMGGARPKTRGKNKGKE